MHDGKWGNSTNYRIGVIRTHVAAGRMLTPLYQGRLPHSVTTEWVSNLPETTEWEDELVAWLRNCCQGLWRLDLQGVTVQKMSGQYSEYSWHCRFERRSDAVLYKLART